jgi:hypothetical protein
MLLAHLKGREHLMVLELVVVIKAILVVPHALPVILRSVVLGSEH